MTMLLAMLLLLAQDRVEMKDFQSSYVVSKPEEYHDRASWPVVFDCGGVKAAPREPGAFVVRLDDRHDEKFILACLLDLKTRYRVHPERVIARGSGDALTIAIRNPDLFAGVVVQDTHNVAFDKQKPPPCLFMLPKGDPQAVRAVTVAMMMRKRGDDVEVRPPSDEPGAILGALLPRLKVRGDLPKADELQRQGRYLDASLILIDLLDNPETERLARTKLKSLEGAALIELSKVEIAMTDRKYKDAVLRCREAAKQFAWIPTGERIKKRLGELESRPEVKKALETDD